MKLEYYIQGEDIPALYDWTLTVGGRYKLMYPPPQQIGVIQVVLESLDGKPTPAQIHAIDVIREIRPKEDITFFGDCFVDVI